MHSALPALTAQLAPTGALRAVINLGNPLLATRAADGRVTGVSVDLAAELARRLAVPLRLLVVDKAAQAVAALEHGAAGALEQPDAADIGFFAIDPARAGAIAFTHPYLLIEGCYLVRASSAVRANDDVDRAAHTVVVGHGSAYDLFLSRSLQHARIVRADSSAQVLPLFLSSGADVAAGVRQQLEMDAAACADPASLRLLPQRFMTIRQAMGVARARGGEAADYLAQFVETVKADGLLAAAMARHGVTGAVPAPPGAGAAAA